MPVLVYAGVDPEVGVHFGDEFVFYWGFFRELAVELDGFNGVSCKVVFVEVVQHDHIAVSSIFLLDNYSLV